MFCSRGVPGRPSGLKPGTSSVRHVTLKVGMLPGNFNQKSLQEISKLLAGKYIFPACLDHYTVFVLLILHKSLTILQMVMLLPTQHPPQ
jgi:hypothetical protein